MLPRGLHNEIYLSETWQGRGLLWHRKFKKSSETPDQNLKKLVEIRGHYVVTFYKNG